MQGSYLTEIVISQVTLFWCVSVWEVLLHIFQDIRDSFIFMLDIFYILVMYCVHVENIGSASESWLYIWCAPFKTAWATNKRTDKILCKYSLCSSVCLPCLVIIIVQRTEGEDNLSDDKAIAECAIGQSICLLMMYVRTTYTTCLITTKHQHRLNHRPYTIFYRQAKSACSIARKV